MVLPRWLGKINRSFTNRLLGRIPSRFSPFVIVHHRGRNTGHLYSVPLAAFRSATGLVFTPTYGPDADWVRNLLAADAFDLDRRGTTYRMNNARLVNRTEAWPDLPRPVRTAMIVLQVRSFVVADFA